MTVVDDPEERTDISADHPDVVERMKSRIIELFDKDVVAINLALFVDKPEAYDVMDKDPVTGDEYWAPGWCNMDP